MDNNAVFPNLDKAKYITLFGDASYDSKTKAYGWCVWIKYGSPAQTIVRSGGGIGIANSTEAEYQALAEGMKCVIELGNDTINKNIVVQSDCLYAIERIDKMVPDFLQTTQADRIYTKHVKGHQGTRTPRSAVNTLCDLNAKREMRKYRAKG